MLRPALALSALLFATSAVAGPPVQDPKVGGAQMYPSRTIYDNLARSHDHDTLINAVRQTAFDEVLRGPGPFTLFAPTDAAFDRTPGAHDLTRPENKGRLTHVFDCSMVQGVTSVAQLQELIALNDGRYTMTTVGGCALTATMDAKGNVLLTDDSGATARIVVPDINQQNGTVQVVDRVLMP